MKIRLLGVAVLAISLTASARTLDTRTPGESVLPTDFTVKTILNETPRHGEWHQVVFGSTKVQSYIVYPDRSSKAPVLLITANDQKMTDLLRAVADQTAQEGFISVVPDLLSGNTGLEDIRDYALRLPAAAGQSASLLLNTDASGQRTMQARVNAIRMRFAMNERAWPEAITFLNKHTNNYPALLFLPAHSHMAHMGATAFEPQRGPVPQQAGYPTGKLDHLPAGLMTAKSTLARTKIRSEWVDIPMGTAKLRTKIAYPEAAKAPVVIVMHHGPGLDPWMESVADQLAREGLVAVLPDLLSGMGPNGGNTPSFLYEDEIIKANGRVGVEETMRRYKVARDYAMKLPQANGKSSSLGFCAGGGSSFRFAGEVPELNAAVLFYGGPPDEATMKKINGAVLAFAGTDDVRVAAGTEEAIPKMKNLGKRYETHIYPHATHSFLQYQNIGGNAQATADAWPRAMAFLKEHTE